jgi:hypothetical protein
MRVFLCLCLSAAAVIVGSAPVAARADSLVTFTGYNANTLKRNDDLSTGAVALPFNLDFFGTTYSSLFVNNNGNLTFKAALNSYTPFGLTTSVNTPIIAPFFADVDTRYKGAAVTYGTGIFDGHETFAATWDGVGHYYAPNNTKFDQFQVLLISRPDTGAGNFDIEFNYGSILWETGDLSGGTNGLGGSSAHVGYSAGTGATGTSAELPGSGVPGSFLDGGPDALNNQVIIYQVRNGIPTEVPSAPLPSAALGGLALLATVGGIRRFRHQVARAARPLRLP